ncbi:nitrate reductase [Phytobacter diazotrophicus]|nr:nitrate reductase [Phytobacter diazotrophicus]MDV2900044.1 nitrate reductase [Phytobacter diazotrophicus]
MMSTRTTCPYCGVGCGVVATVTDDGVSVEGDRAHPANVGRLCVKGAALGQTTGLAGRLLAPQVDEQTVSWQAALDAAGERLNAIISEFGPQAVAFYASGQLLTEDYYAANKLMKGFIGAANIDTNSRLCMSSAVTGYKRAFGADVVPCSYEDIEKSDLLVLVGSNAAWTHPVLYQRIVQAKHDNPALKVVVVDPRVTATCDIADLHLPLAPGSDAGLFVGLLNMIAKENQTLVDFDDSEAALAAARTWTPEVVASFCNLSRDVVTMFYDWFITAPRAMTLFTMGINQSSSGSDKCNAIMNVHLASGKFARPGCGPFSLTGQPNAMGGREVGGLATQLAAHMNFEAADLARLARFWGTERLAQTPGLMAVDLFEAIGRGEVKAVWIMGTNPAVSLPDSHAVCHALAACPLVIVSEVVAQTDTSRYAHIRFPALAWGEKNGTVTNSERRISRQRPFLPPPGEAKADWWIISQVAQHLGFGSAFAWQHPHEVFSEHAALSGFENNGTRAFDISELAGLTREQWDRLEPYQWSVTPAALQRGWRPSGRLRTVPVSPARAVAQPTARYPLLLNTGRIRDQWHTMTRTGTVARLMQHIAEPVVDISPADAARFALSEGDLAHISSPRGVMVARARIQHGQREGELFTPMHWNHAFACQGKVNALVAPVCDPHSGQPESKQTAVRIAAWQPDWQGEIYARETPPLPAVLYWVRKATDSVLHFTLAGNGDASAWLTAWCQTQGWKIQTLRAGTVKNLLAWHHGQLMLGWWSDTRLPVIAQDVIVQAFITAPATAQARHSLLAGQSPSSLPVPGRTVCSCYSVGENAIRAAIAKGCDSTAALGNVLRCGTNCGSCLPELKALLSEAAN